MQRHEVYNATVLKISKTGEGHALVHFIVDEGEQPKLLAAFFFGLSKSKKNYGVTQFQSGKLWVYYNPVTKAYKVTDLQVTEARAGLSDSLVRVWCAGLASELALKMHGNIRFVLITAFLDGIAASNDEECKLATLRFLWRVLLHAGVAPSLEVCAACEKELSQSQSLLYVYKPNSEVYCEECAGANRAEFLPLSAEAQKFLWSVSTEPGSVSRKRKLSPPAEQELRTFLFFFVQQLVGSKLKTLEAGII